MRLSCGPASWGGGLSQQRPNPVPESAWWTRDPETPPTVKPPSSPGGALRVSGRGLGSVTAQTGQPHPSTWLSPWGSEHFLTFCLAIQYLWQGRGQEIPPFQKIRSQDLRSGVALRHWGSPLVLEKKQWEPSRWSHHLRPQSRGRAFQFRAGMPTHLSVGFLSVQRGAPSAWV